MDFSGLAERIRGRIAGAQGRFGFVLQMLETGERMEVNPDGRFPAASVIKLPILSALYRAQSEGRLNLRDTTELAREDQAGGSGVLKMLTPGLVLTLYDLAMLMITVSDNTATNLLIDRLGFDYISASMEADGMRKSSLSNKLQTVPAAFNGRNEITAGDVAEWFVRLSRGALVSLWASHQMIEILKQQQYLNKIPGRLPDPDPGVCGALPLWQFAGKTGMVQQVEHDSGILYLPGASFMVVALTSQCPDAIAVLQELGWMIYSSWVGSS